MTSDADDWPFPVSVASGTMPLPPSADYLRGLEDAAKVADDEDNAITGGWGEDSNLRVAMTTASQIAAAIRSLAGSPPAVPVSGAVKVKLKVHAAGYLDADMLPDASAVILTGDLVAIRDVAAMLGETVEIAALDAPDAD